MTETLGFKTTKLTAESAKKSKKEAAIETVKQRFVRHSNLKKSEENKLPEDVRLAAVLIVLRLNVDRDDEDCWDVLLTLRPSNMRYHPGLVCLPGGKLDKGEDAVSGALREAHEEVNLNPHDVEVLWSLEPTSTIGDVVVKPVVAVLTNEYSSLRRNPDEVEDIFWMPLSEFLKVDSHRSAVIAFNTDSLKDVLFLSHYFDYSSPDSTHMFTVWGITGRILIHTSSIVFNRTPYYITKSDETSSIDLPYGGLRILSVTLNTEQLVSSKL